MRMGWIVTDKRGGDNTLHSWDLGLKGPVSADQREVLDAIIKGRRHNKWRQYPGEEGRPLTIDMVRELCDRPGLSAMLDDLVARGYLVLRHPRTWVDGRRVTNESAPLGYDIAFGQLSFEVTRLLDGDCVCPTIVPTDVGHIGVIVRRAGE